MGLDMYLFRKNKNFNDDEIEVAYWRKANEIRQWFVNNTNYDIDANCEFHKLTKKDLVKLINDCKTVLESHEFANEIMPTSSGFFFGDTEYDEYYFDDLEYTIKTINQIISETDWDNEEIYYYEWW